jgi:hypothetical protein
MTEESCVSFCDSQGYYFAGVEYSDECCELDNPVPAVCIAHVGMTDREKIAVMHST